MTDNDNGRSAPQVQGVQQANIQMVPGDSFILCLVKAGTESLQIISDGSKPPPEYAMMLLAAIQTILVQLNEEKKKEKSPIIDPFAGVRVRR